MVALAQNPVGATKRKIGILSGVNPAVSTWRAVLAELRQNDWLDESSGLLRLTPTGLRALGDYEPLPTGEALLDYWREQIGNPARVAIFDAVVAARGEPVPAAEAARRAGVDMTKSTWRAHMAALRGLDLVSGTRELRANAELFE